MAKADNMAMVLQALKNAGLNDNQARILGAEIGRENAFQDKYLWGYHSDPKNKALNIGIISWQGNRGRGVESALRNAGLIKDGRIVKGQDSLDVMAKYLVNEIKTKPTYAQTRKQFLENPDVDYKTGTQVLGRNFIRWRYDDPAYASGHKNRDKFYKQLGGVIPAGGKAVTDTKAQAITGIPATQTSPDYTQGAPSLSDKPLVPTPPATDTDLLTNLQGGAPTTLLQGGVGLAVPETPTENQLFDAVAGMGLSRGLESIYAEAAKAIAGAKDRIGGRPMIQSTNPLRAELSSIFDAIDV